jgi:methylated-DNA-[protein]-cysteine S-methyltransferase
MTPAVHALVPSPLGVLTVSGTRAGALTGVFFEGHRHPPTTTLLGERDDSFFGEAREQLAEYFAGTRQSFDLVLAPVGEPFQLRVWSALTAIPWGERRSYGSLAATLGGIHLARAVGAANGRNPLSIIVPCHRVLGASGSLVGYAGGLDRKRFLLEHEQPADAAVSRLF